jgi:hypothetical protein
MECVMFKPSYLDKNHNKLQLVSNELLVILRQRDIGYVHNITPEYYVVTETTQTTSTRVLSHV